MDQTYSRFETVPYRAEGGFSAGGSALLLMSSLTAGLVLGIIAGFVSKWFWLVLFFAAAVGAGVGGVGYWAIRVGKVRNTVLGAVSGLMGGFFAMLSMHYVHYLEFESGLSMVPPEGRKVMRQMAQLTPAQVEMIAEPDLKKVLQDPVGRAQFAVHDFLSYMHFRATAGVQFSSSRNFDKKDGGMNLGYVGSWIYWIVEVLIVAGIALAMQYVAAKQPFCSWCQNWKTSRTLGAVPESDLGPLRDGDLTHFATPPPPGAQATILVNADVCPHCQDQAPIDLKLLRLVPTKEGVQQQEVAHVTYPGEALLQLEVIFSPLQAPAAAPGQADAATDALPPALPAEPLDQAIRKERDAPP